MRNIAIIPARSGSKGLKDKNIKDLCGKPLMAYSIEAAIKSNVFDEVMVSTDSTVYADIAKNYGARVPFLRSDFASSDSASTWDAIVEVIQGYKKLGERFDSVCILQPTSPLRTANHIVEAYETFYSKKAESVVSVCLTDHSPLWENILPKDDCMDGFLSREINADDRRQDLEDFYRINGAIYICGINEALTFDLYNKGCYAYKMSRKESVDIDDDDDFELAEYYMKKHSYL